MSKGKVVGADKDTGVILFDPSNWRERFYRHIVDHRLCEWTTIELIGRRCNKTAVLVVEAADLKRATFIYGRRIK